MKRLLRINKREEGSHYVEPDHGFSKDEEDNMMATQILLYNLSYHLFL